MPPSVTLEQLDGRTIARALLSAHFTAQALAGIMSDGPFIGNGQGAADLAAIIGQRTLNSFLATEAGRIFADQAPE